MFEIVIYTIGITAAPAYKLELDFTATFTIRHQMEDKQCINFRDHTTEVFLPVSSITALEITPIHP